MGARGPQPGQPTNRKLTPSRVRTAERDAQVMALRRSGATFAEIGRQMGMTGGSAFRACQRAMSRLSEEDAEFYRSLCLERLEWYHRRLTEISVAVVPVLYQGKPVYVDSATGPVLLRDRGPEVAALLAALRVQESFRKLLGLDAAERVEHSGPGGGPIPIEEHAAKQQAILARISQLRPVAGELPPAADA